MERPAVPNTPQESKEWAQIRSVRTIPRSSEYTPEPVGIASTYQPTLSQSTYTGVSSEFVNQAPSGQLLDPTQTVFTQCLKDANHAYEKNISFTPGGDIQSDRRKCVGYGLGKNRCPSVVLRDSGNASDRCDKCSKLHRLHEQWINGRKKRATS